jgi:hypothetical protein
MKTGSTKTSAGTSSPPSDHGARIPVKSRVPSSVFSGLQTGMGLVKKVTDRQQQGFTLLPQEWGECVEEIHRLTQLLNRCVFEEGGGGGERGVRKDPGGIGNAKIAPSG